jgi:hypothetical protein
MLRSTDGERAKRKPKTTGWICQQTGLSRMQVNRLAERGKITGMQPRDTPRSHRRFEDSPDLRECIRGLRDKKKHFVPTPKRVRGYVRENVPAPPEAPESEFAAAVRQVKSAKDSSLRRLANLMVKEEARIGKPGVYAVLAKEGFSSHDLSLVDALLALPSEADEVLETLTCQHALAVIQAKHLTQSARVRWLRCARNNALDPLELKCSIASRRVRKREQIRRDSGHNSGIRTIHANFYAVGG